MHDKNNWGLIDFQKSMPREIEKISFTVNVGIVSGSLLNFFARSEPDKKVEIYDKINIVVKILTIIINLIFQKLLLLPRGGSNRYYRLVPTCIDVYRPISTCIDQYRRISARYRSIQVDIFHTNTDLYRPVSTYIDVYRAVSTCIDLYRPISTYITSILLYRVPIASSPCF